PRRALRQRGERDGVSGGRTLRRRHLSLPLTLALSPQAGRGDPRGDCREGWRLTMPELLLELFSEEIPARMQGRAAEDLRRLITDGLKAQGVEAGGGQAFAPPRRPTLVGEGVPAKSPDISEERKGPRVNAPAQAILGFVKSAGLKSIEDALIVKDDKKGDFYVVKVEKPGRAATEIVAELVPAVAAKFPWPK